MNKTKLWELMLIVTLIITLVLSPVVVQAEVTSLSTVDVLVNFHQTPTANDISLVESYGGVVKMVYSIVPTIAVALPLENVKPLSKEKGIKSIERDTAAIACLTGETLPWGVDRIDAEQVHPTNKGTGVKVAVLDTGIDLDHPDLSVAGNVTFVPYTINGDDDNGHGTQVAGIIGALDNDIGVIGVAPEASLYAVKVLNSNGDGVMSVILSGIQWAVNNGMQVINMSFGSPYGMPTSVLDAINVAYNAGIVVVAGAGNGGNPEGTGNNVWAPASYSSVIAVGCLDDTNTRYSTSSTGYQLEVMAPGVGIYSTMMGGDYAYITSTSAASPHVAGAAALLIHAGITSNTAVRHLISNSATDLGVAGWDPQYGYGLVNVVSALNFSEPPDQTAPVTTIALNGTLGDNGWYKADNVIATISAADSGSGIALTQYSTDGGVNWTNYTVPLTFSAEGSHLLLARSWDNAGNNEMPAFTSFKLDKTPPAVTLIVNPVSAYRAKAGTLIGIQWTITLSDSLAGIQSWDTILVDEYGVYNQDLGTPYQSTVHVEQWCLPNDANGRIYTFQLTAYDGAGNQSIAQATCTILK